MAIYFDGKILEPKENGSSLEQKYFNELKDVKDLFGKFRKPGQKESVLLFSRDFKKTYNRSKTSYKPAPPIAIPMNVSVYDPQMGSIEIRYSKRPPVKAGNNLIWSRDGDSLMFETMSITDKQLDLAWFLLKASDYVEKGILKLVDKELEFEGKYESILKQTEVASAIFNHDANGDPSLERLELIASILFPNNEIGHYDSAKELATKIWNLIVIGEANKKSYNYNSALKAAEKAKKTLAKEKPVAAENITVTLPDGEDVTFPLLVCPPKTKNETLFERAESVGLPGDMGLSRDVLYSLIKYKLEG